MTGVAQAGLIVSRPRRGIKIHPAAGVRGRHHFFQTAVLDAHAVIIASSKCQRPAVALGCHNSPGIDCHPTFSPDGRRIAFTSNRDGKYEIYLMNADGGGVQRVTKHSEHNSHPCWHPDGKDLVFVGERQGRHDLYQCPAPQ
jgi:Tol biopolymer transport system component